MYSIGRKEGWKGEKGKEGKEGESERTRLNRREERPKNGKFWSAEEDVILLEGHKKFGGWKAIAKLIPGRTLGAVRRRHDRLGGDRKSVV